MENTGNQHDFQFSGICISMENQQNIFSELFLHFVFSLLEAMQWNLLLILVSLKNLMDVQMSYMLNKNSFFECFPAILYLSFLRYHPLKKSAAMHDANAKSNDHIVHPIEASQKSTKKVDRLLASSYIACFQGGGLP